MGRKAQYGRWVCNICNQIFKTRREKASHNKKFHRPNGIVIPWNKGLTVHSDYRILLSRQKLKERYKNGTLKPSMLGKKLSIETREKISNSMKLAHKEGRAHNIGECRWNNTPSWPEQWFMNVIENEHLDNSYEREYPFFRFSLDFAWIDKKLCVEIDGKQHDLPEQHERDVRKDNLLKENGWKLLRLRWSWIYNNSKEAVSLIKNFLSDASIAQLAEQQTLVVSSNVG